MNTCNSETGVCYKGGFPRASPEPIWIQGAVHMRLVWVWATVVAKCQQGPRIGTQFRVGLRRGHVSVYQVLRSYFLHRKCFFLLLLSVLRASLRIRVRKVHVGRKWETNVLLQKTDSIQVGSKLEIGFAEMFCEEINRLALRIGSSSTM